MKLIGLALVVTACVYYPPIFFGILAIVGLTWFFNG